MEIYLNSFHVVKFDTFLFVTDHDDNSLVEQFPNFIGNCIKKNCLYRIFYLLSSQRHSKNIRERK